MAASILGFGLPIAGFMTRQIAAQIDGQALVAGTRRYARRVATRRRGLHSPRRYVILGHTHRPEAHEWTSARRSVVYLNPGAWPPRVDAPAAQVGPHFVWLGRRHDAYVRRPPCSISRPAGPISTRRTWKGSGMCAPPPASAAWSAS